MTDVAPDLVARAMAELLREAFEGSPHPGSWFVSNEPESGVLGTLGRLSAAEASRERLSGRPTLVAHAEHLRFSLAAARAWLRGEEPRLDWSQSWLLTSCDGAGWRELLARLRAEYEELHRAIESATGWTEPVLTGAMGAIAHSAYHLGVIRLLARDARS